MKLCCQKCTQMHLRIAGWCSVLRCGTLVYSVVQSVAMQCVAMGGSVLQCVAVCSHTTHGNALQHTATHCTTLQHTAPHCTHYTTEGCLPFVLGGDPCFRLFWEASFRCSTEGCPPKLVCCNVLQCVAVCCSVLQCVAVRCSVLQCVAMCCSVLQCAAVCCRIPPWTSCFVCAEQYGVATSSGLLKIIDLFCKRAL